VKGVSTLFAENEAKRSVEVYWLKYTVVWGVSMGVVMLGGFADRWGDVPCMILGVLLMLGALVGPIWVRPASDRGVPLHRTTAFKMGLSVFGLAVGLNYSQTPFFWDVLHMHYGFKTTWNIENNPVFLYFVSVAYFATYAVLVLMAFRFLRAKLAGTPRPVQMLAYAIAPLSMAFFETALNANPFIASLFCYDDLGLMLWFGTLSYGVAFIFALPMWLAIDEVKEVRVPALRVLVWLFAALYADVITLDLLRYHVAPHVTTVETGAMNLRDYGEGCLEQPEGATP
jgi:cycloeucalenol cycloisomerase